MEGMEKVSFPGQPGYQGAWDTVPAGRRHEQSLHRKDEMFEGALAIAPIEDLEEAVNRVGNYLETNPGSADALHRLSLITTSSSI